MSAHVTIDGAVSDVPVVPILPPGGLEWKQRGIDLMTDAKHVLRTIGISGTGPGSGKDTAAKLISLLLEERGIRTSIRKFATPIRQQAKEETGIPIEVSETTEGKNILLTKFKIATNLHLEPQRNCVTHGGLTSGESTIPTSAGLYLHRTENESSTTWHPSAVEVFISLLKKETGDPIEIREADGGRYILLGGRGITVGRYLQLIGSFMKDRTGNPNFWIDKLFADFTPNEVVIISDVRFPLEQAAVKKRRGVNILINSSRQTDEAQMAGRDVEHESERALDGAVMDYVVENGGSVEELSERLRQLIDTLFPRTVQ